MFIFALLYMCMTNILQSVFVDVQGRVGLFVRAFVNLSLPC